MPLTSVHVQNAQASWRPASIGARVTATIAELIDLFPTISSLVGSSFPIGVDGKDLSPVFSKPSLLLPGADAAYSQYPRFRRDAGSYLRQQSFWSNNHNLSPDRHNDKIVAMGYAVKTVSWRYVAWMPFSVAEDRALWDAMPYAIELYTSNGTEASRIDFDKADSINVAGREASRPVLAQLHRQIRSQHSQAHTKSECW